jgi:hypothetical protein
MPDELRMPAPASPLHLPHVDLPASLAALLKEGSVVRPIGLRAAVDVPAETSELADIAVGPPRPETPWWRGRGEQAEFDVDIALFGPEECQGEGIGLALTAAWAAIAPIPKGTQDALDFGNSAATTHVVGRRAPRRSARPRGPRMAVDQAALF